MSKHRYTNTLINSSSPYLLQHAHNPVNWQPWSQDVIQEAYSTNKLLIISIGYAACHWCHVMEKECFEDTTVAKVMNQHYLSIKVDREERPDIDNVYMAAANMITGRGGWPLNVIALPDGRPIYAGTYFPKDKWIQVLQYFKDQYDQNQPALIEQADKISQGIREMDVIPEIADIPAFEPAQLDAIFDQWRARIDYMWGGRNGAPKFPMPDNWLFLLQYHFSSNNKQAKEAVHVTLTKMAQGGIYDQLGGGFARYSVDGLWKVPHFEKMLYDNGQLLSLYSLAYAASKVPLYKKVVEETIAFIDRELSNGSGGYFSALDADSEGEEGRYYVWTMREIEAITGEAAPLLTQYYNLRKGGNFEAGKNVLFITQPLPEVANTIGIEQSAAQSILEGANNKLLAVRDTRVRPALDDKGLTSWNALVMQGFIDAYLAIGEPTYLQMAIDNATFISNQLLHTDYTLFRNYKAGKSSIHGFLDDYALLAKAFISLYQASFDRKWLTHCIGLVNYVDEHFSAPDQTLYFYTADKSDPLIVRQIETSDNVIPASNSVMAEVLFLLGHLLANTTYTSRSATMVATMVNQIRQQPPFFSRWAKVQWLHTYAPIEVAIVGPQAKALRREMGATYAPDLLYLGSNKPADDLPLLAGKYKADKTMIYVCQNKVCHRPVETVADAWQEIHALRSALRQ